MSSQILNKLKLVESIVATAAYMIVAGLLIVDVVGRELFGMSLLGAQQLAVYGAIVAGFLGLTLATSDNCHLRPAFLDFVFHAYEHWPLQLIVPYAFISSGIKHLIFALHPRLKPTPDVGSH